MSNKGIKLTVTSLPLFFAISSGGLSTTLDRYVMKDSNVHINPPAGFLILTGFVGLGRVHTAVMFRGFKK